MRLIIGEQTEDLDSRFARMKRELFADQGIEFLQLNWRSGIVTSNRSSEPIYVPAEPLHLAWSEGRDLVAKLALQAGADFLILCDDDIFLLPNTRFWRTVLRQPNPLLERTRSSPRAMFKLRRDFHQAIAFVLGRVCPKTVFSRVFGRAVDRLQAELADHDDLTTGAILSLSDWGLIEPRHLHLHDLQTQVFSRRAAGALLPAPVVGSGGSGWYIQYLALHFWPNRHRRLSSVLAINLATRPHQDSSLEHFNNVTEVVRRTDHLIPGFSDFFDFKDGELLGKLRAIEQAIKLAEVGASHLERERLLRELDLRLREAVLEISS